MIECFNNEKKSITNRINSKFLSKKSSWKPSNTSPFNSTWAELNRCEKGSTASIKKSIQLKNNEVGLFNEKSFHKILDS